MKITTPFSISPAGRPLRRWRHLALAGMLLAIGGLALTAAAAEPPAELRSTELLADPAFRRGFILLRPEPGRKVESATVHGPDGGDPVWNLAQWSSRYPFDETTTATVGEGGGFQLATAARSAAFGGEDGILTLAVNTAVEYGDRPRAGGEPWVHLLVEQRIATAPRLGDLSALRLRIEARRIRADLARSEGYDPRIHAAQFLIFLTIQNLEKDSPEYGNFLWFGIPVFDNRSRMVQPHAHQDFAGSKKFIYTPGSESYTRGSTHDEGWVPFDADLLPLIHEGLATARARGFLTGLTDDGRYRVTSLNMGWEVPGTFDVEMQVRRFSLAAIEPAPGP